MNSHGRQQLLARLQAHIKTLALPSERICPFSFQKSFLCRGFAQWLWDSRELRLRNGVPMLPLGATELRGLLDSWDELRRAGLAGSHCRGILVDEYRLPCDGWGEYSETELARLCRDFGLSVETSPLLES